jgi:hypothetical protein
MDLVKEFDEIRVRVARIRDILDERGLLDMAQAHVDPVHGIHLRSKGLADALASQRATTDRRTYPECDVEPGEGMRLMLPLASFDEQISEMIGRILKATDDLRDHNRRVLGPQPTIGLGEVQEKIAYDRPSGALDRLTETIGALEGAVIYLEMQVSAATGLA